MAHPANAAYVSGDGKVSFDQWGRKLDSLGNVAWGDRQTVQGAGGRPIERPQQQQQQPAQQQAYNPLAGGSANTGVPVRTGSAMAPAPAQARPAALLPGGIDPATGQKVPTYYNGGMALPGDDYFMRNPQVQQQAQQAWRPAPPMQAQPQAQQNALFGQYGRAYIPTFGNTGVPTVPGETGPFQLFPPNIDANGTLSFGARPNPQWRPLPTYDPLASGNPGTPVAPGVPPGYGLGGDPSGAYYSGFGIRP